MSALAANLIGKEDLGEKSVQLIKRVLETLVNRVETVFDELREVEDFFQPGLLELICKYGNAQDKKRSYTAGLQSITCKRAKNKVVVQMPNNYRLPNRNGIEALKEAFRVL